MTAEDKQKIEYWPVERLIPYDKNPRDNSPAVDACAESIKRFGFRGAIEVDKDGVIVCGHTRRLAAMKLGVKEVPVVVDDDLPPELIRARRVADNKISELSTWDEDLLQKEVAALPEFDFGVYGFTSDELNPEPNASTEEDAFDFTGRGDGPEVLAGDVWKVGGQVVACAEPDDADALAAAMKAAKAKRANAMVCAIPRMDAHATGEEARASIAKAFSTAAGAMADGAAFYAFYEDADGYEARGAAMDAGLQVRECLVWDFVKSGGAAKAAENGSRYARAHFPCLYGWKDGAAHKWRTDRKQTTVMDFRPRADASGATPIAAAVYLIRNSCSVKDVVVDPWGGWGTTAVAAARTNRTCVVLEADPRKASVALARLEAETGKAPELKRRNGEQK